MDGVDNSTGDSTTTDRKADLKADLKATYDHMREAYDVRLDTYNESPHKSQAEYKRLKLMSRKMDAVAKQLRATHVLIEVQGHIFRLIEPYTQATLKAWMHKYNDQRPCRWRHRWLMIAEHDDDLLLNHTPTATLHICQRCGGLNIETTIGFGLETDKDKQTIQELRRRWGNNIERWAVSSD